MNKLRLAALALAALLVAVLMLPALTPSLTAQDVKDDDDLARRTISTSGTGRVGIQPDFAVVTLGVMTEAEEAAAAMSDNNTAMQAVVDALQQAGVPEEDIQTQILTLNPRYAQPQPPEQTTGELIGYQANNLVEVRLESVDTIGQVIDAAVQAGANRIESIYWDVEDQNAALDEAREEAWQDAFHKAEQLADLASAALGPVMTITESSGPIIPFYADVRMEAAAAVPIQPGQQNVEVMINVTWQLVDAGTNGATTPTTDGNGAGGTGTPTTEVGGTPGATSTTGVGGTPRATSTTAAGATPRATSTTAAGATPRATSTTAAGGTGSAEDEVTIELVADGNEFNLDTITVPAGSHVVVEFTNEDSVPHNLAVYTDETAEEEIFVGDTITGPGETITYEFDAPEEEGIYFFRCDVHPTMNGDFVVE